MVRELSGNYFVYNGLRMEAARISDETMLGGIPLHRHAENSLEFHFVLSGRGKMKTPEQEFTADSGDFFITLGEAEHEQCIDPRDPMRELCIYATFKKAEKEDKAARQFLSCPFRRGKADEDMVLCARQMVKELHAKKKGTNEALSCYFRLLLICAERAQTDREKDRGSISADGALFLKIEEAFLYDFRTVTLSSLARDVGLSERQLQRVLRERYSQTFTQKRTEARMRAANMMLAEGKYTVTRIAEEAGYSCAEHFCTEYKKYTGMTARAYRRLCRAEQATSSDIQGRPV